MNTENLLNQARANLIDAGKRLATAESAINWSNTSGYVDEHTRACIAADYERAKNEVDLLSKSFEAALLAHRLATQLV